MSGYLGYFFEEGRQALSLGAAIVVWIGLYSIGAALVGRGGIREAYPIFGWAFVSLLFTVGGVFTSIPFTAYAIVTAIVAVASAIYVIRRDGALVSSDVVKMGVLSLPLLLLVSAMSASQWDEFSHWLPSARFLLETDGFPNATDSNTGSSLPAYPYGWPLLSYLAGRLAGGFIENIGALLNLFILLSFGLVIASLVRETTNSADRFGTKSWPLVALGALTVTLFNPTFVQKLALTAYSEISTAVTTGLASLLAWRLLEKLGEDDRPAAMSLAWQAALVLSLLVNVRQSNLVLFVVVLIALFIVAWRDPRIPLRRLVRPFVPMIILPVGIYLVWRYHVAGALSSGEFSIRPFSGWFIDLIPQILVGMVTVASKKGVYFGLMIIVVAIGLIGFFRPTTPLRRFAMISGLLFLGYNAFLFFTYVAAFGKFDALRVASYWRYNTHAGLAGVVFAAYGGTLLWQRYVTPHWRGSWHGWLAIALFVAAPFVFAKKIRFDREEPKPFFRTVATDVAPMLGSKSRLFVLDPEGSGESWVITRFHVGREIKYGGYLSAFHKLPATKFRSHIERTHSTNVLVYSVNPAVEAAFGLSLSGGRAHLLSRTEIGAWRIQKSWQDTGTR